VTAEVLLQKILLSDIKLITLKKESKKA